MHILFLLLQILQSPTFLFDVDNSSNFKLDGQSITQLKLFNNELYFTSNKSLMKSGTIVLLISVIGPKTSAYPLKFFIDHRGNFWLSLAKDTIVGDGTNFTRGAGIAYKDSNSTNWLILDQPVDSKSNYDRNFIEVPVTTTIQNVSYDIEETYLDASGLARIWISSFAGSLRYIYTDSVELNHWHLVRVNNKKLNVANNSDGLAQRAFSLASDGKKLWVGTAQGVFLQNEREQLFINDTAKINGLSGNFITYLEYSKGQLFANALPTFSGETALNILDTANFSQSLWKRYFITEGIYSVFTLNSDIYVSNEQGIFKKSGADLNFNKHPHSIKDNLTGLYFSNTSILSFLIDTASNNWYAASTEGLAISSDNGINWKILKSAATLQSLKVNNNILAFPSPYSPAHNKTNLSIVFALEESSQVQLDIFNLAMEKVFSESYYKSASESCHLYWNAASNLSNGVYFIKVTSAKQTYWTKVVILN
jgi:hypothetical protein